MQRSNLFDGDSYKAEFSRITYRWLISRRWFTYANIMADRLGCSVNELPSNLSNCEGYGELKKTVGILKKAICEKVGNDCFEEEGNNRNKCFRYIGKDNDPLADMRNAKAINNLRQYWKFCQDSAGFFPKSWLEYFFMDCQDLLDIKARRQKGELVINASLDRILTNIEFLPFIYEAITNKKVLQINYKPFEEESVMLLFHPHYLKEYNGRWHLFGHAEGKKPVYGYNIALDRIQSKPRERSKVKYVPAPKHFYDEFFKDIVGVSHMKDVQKEHIIIRARTLYIFKLMDTKPLHQSYNVVKPFGLYDDGEYAEFSVDVEPNNEFYGHIIQMGAGLEIISPDTIRHKMAQRIHELADLYPKTN
ncbi:MAG: WYL domain-containing protein [Paludibacteraceae bacterium]|nr:WYL domain-containing protein [Paludibacteraceae bacterium]